MKIRIFKSLLVIPILLSLITPFSLTEPVAAYTVEKRVSQSWDDSYVGRHDLYGGGGDLWPSSDYIGFGEFGGSRRTSVMRFTGLELPSGATITSAYITYTANENNAQSTVNSRIWGIKSVTAPTNVTEFWALTKTTEYLDWNSIGSWVTNTEYDTPSLVDIVQELVDAEYLDTILIMHGDWGSDLDARRTPTSYDGDSAKAPLLHIEVQDPIAPTVTNGSGVSNLTDVSARLNGNLTDNGDEVTTVYVYWGDADGIETALDWDNEEDLGVKDEGAFFTDVSSLTPVTEYFYRCYAENIIGGDWADSTESFTTLPSAPTSFTTSSLDTELSLTWTQGLGSTNSYVRFSKTNYPTNVEYLTIEDCEAAWDEYVDADVVSTLDAVDFQVGAGSAKLAVADACGAGDILATMDLTSIDLSTYDGVKFWIKSTVALGQDDLQLLLDNSPNCASPEESLNISAVGNDVWTEITLDLADPASDTAIVSVGLKMVNDMEIFDVHLDDILAQDGPLIYSGVGESYSHTSLDNGDTYYYSAWSYVNPYSASPAHALGVPGLPSVINLDPSNITSVAARLNGEITGTGGINPTVHIYWGDEDGIEVALDWDNEENLGVKGVEAFFYDAGSLTHHTQYYYRCYATNANGDMWTSSTKSFYTLWDDPAIVTLDANPIGTTVATIRADLTDTGGGAADVAEVKLYWGDNDGVENTSNWDNVEILVDESVGVVEKAITGLLAETTYYCRA